jgi:probable sporulation protein (polysaccharide deacetylase family)
MSATAIHASESQIVQRIKQEASTHNIPAIEPKVDRVWHLIPGYNGLEVDIAKTIRATKANKNRITWVIKEVKPLITLSKFKAEPIYKGNSHKRMVALLINVAWGEENLPQMLKILKSNHVKATFFLDGQWLEKHVTEAQRIVADGHQVSNHAYSHKNMSRLSDAQAIEEIERTQKLLKNLGVSNKLFAPPSGDFSPKTLEVTTQLGLRMILWTVDTIDWREKSPTAILTRVVPRIEPGSMILMHPTASATAALHSLIQQIKMNRLKLGTVNELISTKRLEVE